jgi:UDP-N-acetylmuramoyl-tripeptide--D-alanyl-D-alanine ligase
MGASAIGEIAYLCELARPNLTMINNVMPAHIEGFGSIEGVAQAKGEIYSALSAGAKAVVNIDDKFSADWLKNLTEQKLLKVSLNDVGANVFVRSWQQQDERLVFEMSVKGTIIDLELNALGEHSLRNALMAAACATALGAQENHIQQGLKNFAPVAGRMNRQRGYKGALVIDDSYNANPGSVRAAIDVLKQTEESVLVLGDLGELGANAISLHAELGEYARLNNIRHLFTLGQLTQHSAQAFGAGAQHFTDRAELVAALKTLAQASTTFLVKGSRSAKMDLVVNELCNPTGETH